MQEADELCKNYEECLYYAYHNHFEIVEPLLARLRIEGRGKDLETWGRISALVALTQQIEFNEFIQSLNALDNPDAWRGAATVWTHVENIKNIVNSTFRV